MEWLAPILMIALLCSGAFAGLWPVQLVLLGLAVGALLSKVWEAVQPAVDAGPAADEYRRLREASETRGHRSLEM